MSETSGGEVLARMLQAEGVENMAGAYARLTGKLGVCMASNGPGVANILPGLAVENAEGNRVLCITSCRRPQIVYPDRGGTYQSFDQVGAISHLAKWSKAVVSFDRVAELGRTALRHCYEGRPGVVHLDVPETIMNGKVKADVPTWQPHQYRNVHPPVPAPEQVERAAEMLAAAEMPIIHAGSGVIHAGAFAELRRVAELLHAPVTTSWAARGVLPETSELAIPMPFIPLNNEVRNDADLVLAVGTRLGETDWWGKAPYWRHPDRLAPLTGRMNLDSRRRKVSKYREKAREERAKLDEKLTDMAVPMNPAHVAHVCEQVFPMLGAGVAQATGAAVARPEHPVCCIIGDGAMGFHPQEVETAVRNGLRVIYVVLCDRQWGMVKMNQQFMLKPIKTLIKKSLGPDETIKADLGEIRFDDLARSMGAHGERVADPRELKGALERSIASGGPAVVHVDVDPVKHMWAPGLMHFKDMHLEPKGK